MIRDIKLQNLVWEEAPTPDYHWVTGILVVWKMSLGKLNGYVWLLIFTNNDHRCHAAEWNELLQVGPWKERKDKGNNLHLNGATGVFMLLNQKRMLVRAVTEWVWYGSAVPCIMWVGRKSIWKLAITIELDRGGEPSINVFILQWAHCFSTLESVFCKGLMAWWSQLIRIGLQGIALPMYPFQGPLCKSAFWMGTQ